LIYPGAYDNVLAINMLNDILCNIMMDRELPSRIVRFLARLLWRKVLVFFAGGQEYMTMVGYKGLPQRSVLSPFLYNIIGSCADRFVLAGCGFLQYADDLVVYVAHRLIRVARGLIQTACTSLSVFFSSVGLTISSSKSEVMLFSRKHERPPILIRIGSHVLPQATTFKYLGVFFDCALRWSAQTRYVGRRCLQRINLLKSVAGVSWGAHPSCMLLQYRGLIGSVLEYGSVCFTGMAHMLLLERIQYRALRI
jgi:hypothetical protein